MKESRKENIELTPRLALIAARVPQGAALADIGTDHGHLPLWLLREKRISHAAASDIRSGPLEHARENAAFHGLGKNIRFVLAPGLEKIRPEECSVISIAGMGGETIASILAAAPWTKHGEHLLLLQPMTSIYELRQWLWANGYEIVEESVCAEGKRRYVVLSARGGQNGCIKKERWECCTSSPLIRADGAEDYLRHLLHREQKALRGMQQGSEVSEDEIMQQEKIIHQIQLGLEAAKK